MPHFQFLKETDDNYNQSVKEMLEKHEPLVGVLGPDKQVYLGKLVPNNILISHTGKNFTTPYFMYQLKNKYTAYRLKDDEFNSPNFEKPLTGAEAGNIREQMQQNYLPSAIRYKDPHGDGFGDQINYVYHFAPSQLLDRHQPIPSVPPSRKLAAYQKRNDNWLAFECAYSTKEEQWKVHFINSSETNVAYDFQLCSEKNAASLEKQMEEDFQSLASAPKLAAEEKEEARVSQPAPIEVVEDAVEGGLVGPSLRSP